jgi:hypothetical protein
LAGEEKYEGNGNHNRRRRVLALAIIVPVVFLVVIPGFLLIFGLCRAAKKEVPRPGDIAPVRRLVPCRGIVGRRQANRDAHALRRQLARANYN